MKMHVDSPRSVPPLAAELPQAVPAASDGEGDDGPPSPSPRALWGPWAMAHRAHPTIGKEGWVEEEHEEPC